MPQQLYNFFFHFLILYDSNFFGFKGSSSNS